MWWLIKLHFYIHFLLLSHQHYITKKKYKTSPTKNTQPYTKKDWDKSKFKISLTQTFIFLCSIRRLVCHRNFGLKKRTQNLLFLVTQSDSDGHARHRPMIIRIKCSPKQCPPKIEAMYYQIFYQRHFDWPNRVRYFRKFPLTKLLSRSIKWKSH